MPQPEHLEVVDLGAIELGAVLHSSVYFNDLSEPLWFEELKIKIPEEIMSDLTDLLGDGNASVTVGIDVKTSVDYGNSAGCSCFVKLTCNQDETSIDATHHIAETLATEWADAGHGKASRILNQARGFTDEGETPPKTVKAPSKAGANPTQKRPAGKKKPVFKKR